MSLGRAGWDMERDPLCQIRADNTCSKLGWRCYCTEQVVCGQLWLCSPCKPSASPTSSAAANEALPTARQCGEHRFLHSFNLCTPPASANPSSQNGQNLATAYINS